MGGMLDNSSLPELSPEEAKRRREKHEAMTRATTSISAVAAHVRAAANEVGVVPRVRPQVQEILDRCADELGDLVRATRREWDA